jgi:hypothetical protein
VSAQVAEVLRKALAAFGPNGERWAPHAGPLYSGTCAWGCIYQIIWEETGIQPVNDGDKWAASLGFTGCHDLFRWNDSAAWPEVKERFESAIARAEAA